MTEVEAKEIGEVPGLWYIADIGTDLGEVITDLDANANEWDPITSAANSRLVQHYGYTYDYLSSRVSKIDRPIPKRIAVLQSILTDTCIQLGLIKDDAYFNQCIVNNYLPGQGIGKHIDKEAFGDVIGCFTVGGGTSITFRDGDVSRAVYVQPNSLYIMSGASRHDWTHEIAAKKSDMVQGVKVPRQRRVSVTFRNVKL
jgi:alkylated DNA repair dioxygenase AlkB